MHDPQQRDERWHLFALVACAIAVATLPFPWLTVELPYIVLPRARLSRQYDPYPLTESGLIASSSPWTLVGLVFVAVLHATSLTNLLSGWRRQVPIVSAGAIVAVWIPITSHLWRYLFSPPWRRYSDYELHPAFWVFTLAWGVLLVLHLSRLATGRPRPIPLELATAAVLGLVPAAVLGGVAARVEATWPGALGGGGALRVPAPVAIALSACALGFGVALWLRLRLQGGPER